MAEETAGLIPGPDPDLDPAERRLLAAMPLHAITSVHGQAGLRERLLMEIERLPAADRHRPRTRWPWQAGCTRPTGGSANPTRTTCCASPSGS